MRGILLEQPEQLRLVDLPAPQPPGPEEALVRVRRVGICGSDIHAYHGRHPFMAYPRIPGHELGVEIVAVGENDRGLVAGDRCAVEPYLACGKCIACRRGKPNCCVDMQVLGLHTDGGLREFITLPVGTLHKSDALSLDQLALIEPLAIGAHAVARAGLEPDDTILVVGAGPIGISVILSALPIVSGLIVMEVSERRMEFCRRHLGIETCIDARDEPLANLDAALAGRRPTVVFDATGYDDSMMKSFEYVAHGGKLIFVGVYPGDITFDDPWFHSHEMTLYASRNATSDDFARCIRLLEGGDIDAGPMITHRAPLSELIDQFPRWLEPDSGLIKALVEMD